MGSYGVGRRFEYLVVDFLRKAGLKARRVPLSGRQPSEDIPNADIIVEDSIFGKAKTTKAKKYVTFPEKEISELSNGELDFLVLRFAVADGKVSAAALQAAPIDRRSLLRRAGPDAPAMQRCAVAVTKFQRVYEAAVFKTLGASSRTIGAMLMIEYGLLGTLAGAVGSFGALALVWGISRYALDIPWHPALGENVAGTIVTSLLITVIGVAASADVLRRKPLATLRAE